MWVRTRRPISCAAYPPDMDARDRFTSTAEAYARYRPGYPDGVVEAAAAYAGLGAGDCIVDIGAGTGISTRLFARHGFDVVGIEPNDAMRKHAVREGGARYHAGDAAHTGLPAASAAVISCAQALHWFHPSEVVAEWRRVLVPGGACAAYWNFRRDEGWQAEYGALLDAHSRALRDSHRALGRPRDCGVWIRDSGTCRDVAEHEFRHEETIDFPTLLGRARSSSYIAHDVADRPAFEKKLRSLFEKHATPDRVLLRYRTWLLLWRFA